MMDITDVPRRGVNIQHLIYVVLLSMFLLTTMTALAQIPRPHLSSNSDIATAGFYHLKWDTDAERIELQEATTPEFRAPDILYIGADGATTISGKPDGKWYYRVRALRDGQAGPWSETVEVTVAHHSLSRALMFLTIGVIVFISIVTMIIRGSRKVHELS